MYKIKPFQWLPYATLDPYSFSTITIFGIYVVAKKYWCLRKDNNIGLDKEFPCESVEDGKKQIEEDYRNKLLKALEEVK